MPSVLRELLAAGTPTEREAAWTGFLAEFTPVILRAVRSLGGGEDAAMDRYGYVLEALLQEDCRRLRGYQPTGSATFSTWLVVVARRLCLDHYRRRYGRAQGESDTAAHQHESRRRLVDLVGEELALDRVAASSEDGQDLGLERAELSSALADALASLTIEDRLILRLRFEDDASVPEIARLLGEPSPFRTYRRIDRLLAELRRHLTGAGHAPEADPESGPGRNSGLAHPL